MKLEWAALAGAVLIAASILFIGRWQITVSSGGKDAADALYRLDRWSGKTEMCFTTPMDKEVVKALFRSEFAPSCAGPKQNQ